MIAPSEGAQCQEYTPRNGHCHSQRADREFEAIVAEVKKRIGEE